MKPLPASLPTLTTCTGTYPLALELADNFLRRFKGLMLAGPLAPDAALLLTHCDSVHCAFMHYPIDVVYLDRHGIVTKCVAHLKPWRASAGNWGKDAEGKRHARATHTLELAAGSVARWQIRPGDRLAHALWPSGDEAPVATLADAARPPLLTCAPRQRGSALIEFAIVGPVVTLVGLATLQYGMLFFAKNQLNHASFMAARTGSMANADIAAVQAAYETALVPLYGGGKNSAELATSLTKAKNDMQDNLKIELLNPTQESFADWNDPALQTLLNTGSKRVIPNGSQAFKDPNKIGASSGQSIGDANLIKLRITQGYEPKVPLVNTIYKLYLQWMDTKDDSFHTQLVDAGRIPIVTSITMQMQSDAIEGSPISTPGMGNNGTPSDPGDPPVVTTDPPKCATIGCTIEITPTDPGGGGTGGGGTCTGNSCTTCNQAP